MKTSQAVQNFIDYHRANSKKKYAAKLQLHPRLFSDQIRRKRDRIHNAGRDPWIPDRINH